MRALLTSICLGWSGLVAGTVPVYIGTGGTEGIFLSSLHTGSGALAEPRVAVQVERAGFLAYDVAERRLFSTARAPGRTGGKPFDAVASFTVQDDGMLSLVNYQSAKGRGPCFVTLDQTKSMLLLANYGSGCVAAYPVSPNSNLMPARSHFQHEGSSVNERRQSAPHAHSFYPGPDNRFAYAPDLGIDQVVIYKLDSDLREVTPAGSAKTPPGSGPRHMKFGRDGEQAYVLAELTLDVVVYDRDAESGGLTQKEVVSVLPDRVDKEGMTCSEILVSKDGKFVYTANRDVAGRGRDSLSTFTVGEDGRLARVQTVPAEVHIPRNINLSPCGGWLLVAGQKSGGVPVFKVGEDGILKFSGNRIAVENAMCVVFGMER